MDVMGTGLCHPDILATGPRTGIIEGIPNTMSVDSLKKTDPYFTTLADFYQRRWGAISDDALDVCAVVCRRYYPRHARRMVVFSSVVCHRPPRSALSNPLPHIPSSATSCR
jgi:hypothetical protein